MPTQQVVPINHLASSRRTTAATQDTPTSVGMDPMGLHWLVQAKEEQPRLLINQMCLGEVLERFPMEAQIQVAIQQRTLETHHRL